MLLPAALAAATSLARRSTTWRSSASRGGVSSLATPGMKPAGVFVEAGQRMGLHAHRLEQGAEPDRVVVGVAQGEAVGIHPAVDPDHDGKGGLLSRLRAGDGRPDQHDQDCSEASELFHRRISSVFSTF